MSLVRKIASGAVDWRFIYRKWVLGVGGRRGSPQSEVPVKRFLKTLPRGDVFVDVGANVGDYSVLLHKKFRLTVAVEPYPETMKRLQKRIAGSGIVPVESALCEFDGETTLYLSKPPYSSMGVLKPSSGSADTIQQVFHFRPASAPSVDRVWNGEYDSLPQRKVVAQRFDSMIEAVAGSDRRIDLLKIDVEGAEFRVLEGAEKSLQHKIKQIVVELHDRERKRELENILLSYGFFTHWLDPDHIFGRKQV